MGKKTFVQRKGSVDVLHGTSDANKKALFLRVWDTFMVTILELDSKHFH